MKSMATGYGKLSSSRFEKFSYGLLKLELMKYSINGKKRFSMIGEENIKIPTTDTARYVNVTRYVPGGDIFDLNSGTIPLVPQPLQMNFGIAGDVLFPMLGFDLFRGDKIKGQGISEFDDFAVRAKFGLKRFIPNFQFVPGSYSTERIKRAREDKSTLARNESELLAFLNTVGVKIEEADISRLRTIKGFEYKNSLESFAISIIFLKDFVPP